MASAHRNTIGFLAALFVLLSLESPGTARNIAGLNPSERPNSAPVTREYEKKSGWYTNALKGVVKPYPYSLRFLEDQGGWFTPFIHPGMTGPYDIRDLHQAPSPQAQ